MSLSVPVIDSLLNIGGKLIDRLFPNPAERDKAKLELLAMQQRGELAQLAADTELAKGQLEINKTEAASSSLFVAGWRPSVGWICSLALAYQFFGRPLLVAFQFPAPPLDMGDLLTILLGLLGLGGLRTAEKMKGVAR